MSKQWTLEQVEYLLSNNKNMVIKSLLAIYDCQTETEKQLNETNESNGIGFNGVDVQILSNISQFYIKYNRLSQKQFEIVKNKIWKYRKQILKIANKQITVNI